jgi:hypothetical protein
MASHSHKSPQVRSKPTPFIFLSICICNFLTCLVFPLNPKHFTAYENIKQISFYTTMGSTLQYKIGREANWSPRCIQILSKTISTLTLQHDMQLPPHDNDQDMADSSSSTNLKRGQLTIQQSIQQKKTRSDLQSEHQSYANQDIWLGFQAMELLAINNGIPPQDVHTSIRKLIRRGYRKNEAAEIHIAKISFPRIPQQKWPSARLDGRSGHHFHLTQVPSNVEVNPQTSFVLVYHILLNFAKPSITYSSQEITNMTKERLQKMDIELGELCEPLSPLRPCATRKPTGGTALQKSTSKGHKLTEMPCWRELAYLR